MIHSFFFFAALAMSTDAMASSALVASAFGQVVEPTPTSTASGQRGRCSLRIASERSDARMHVDDDGSSDSKESKRTLSSSRPLKVVKHFIYDTNGCDMKCKMCDIHCTDQSPTAGYDPADFEGKVPWRSYTTTSKVANEDGSLTLTIKPSSKLSGCATLCSAIWAGRTCTGRSELT